MENLNPLEFEVLAMLLAGNHPVLAALRDQLKRVEVKKRKMTGVGFFTELALPKDTIKAPLPTKRIHFSDVKAKIPGLKYGAGFVLFISDGRLDMLEGFSYVNSWPDQVESFELSYLDPSRASLYKSFE